MSGSRRRAGVCVPGGTRGPGQPAERGAAEIAAELVPGPRRRRGSGRAGGGLRRERAAAGAAARRAGAAQSRGGFFSTQPAGRVFWV